ncbi:unnamed protein product [Closterium sp. Naga37s-1]|nr:unnamed protein product [Closterium sp. Naga37s-1]
MFIFYVPLMLSASPPPPSSQARVADWSVVRMGQRVHVDMGDGLEGHREGSMLSGSGEDRGMLTAAAAAVLSLSPACLPNPPASVGILLLQLLTSPLHHLPILPVCPILPASVGVLLLQLLTGWAGPFRDVDGQRTHIYHWAQQHLTADDISPLLDPLLPQPLPPPALLLPLFRLALACSSPSPSARPTPSSALTNLRPLRSSLLNWGQSGGREGGEKGGAGEWEGGGSGEDEVGSVGRSSAGSWSRLFRGGSAGWSGGSELGARLAMLGSEDSREFVVGGVVSYRDVDRSR